jgi:hypothetical protein
LRQALLVGIGGQKRNPFCRIDEGSGGHRSSGGSRTTSIAERLALFG